jgi:hypothetical protein
MGNSPVAVNNDRDTGVFETHMLHPGPWFLLSTHERAPAPDAEEGDTIRVIAADAHGI